MKEESKEQNKTQAETITFSTDQLMCYGVLGYEGEEMMAAITGYDLNVQFNMRIINSLADAEACADALADVFYQALMKQLIARNADFLKPHEPE